MTARRDQPVDLSRGCLDEEEAAAYCGLLPKVFSQWVECGLLPAANWTVELLKDSLDHLEQFGVTPRTGTKYSDSRDIPNIHTVKRRNSLGVCRRHYFRRDVHGHLAGKPGSAEFMRSLLQKERQIAASATAAKKFPITENERPKQSAIGSPSISDNAAGAADEEGIKSVSKPPPPDLLTVEQLIARYHGKIAEGTWRNRRSQGTGPPYVKIFREIFYPLQGLIAWEQRNTAWCDLRSVRERDAER